MGELRSGEANEQAFTQLSWASSLLSLRLGQQKVYPAIDFLPLLHLQSKKKKL